MFFWTHFIASITFLLSQWINQESFRWCYWKFSAWHWNQYSSQAFECCQKQPNRMKWSKTKATTHAFGYIFNSNVRYYCGDNWILMEKFHIQISKFRLAFKKKKRKLPILKYPLSELKRERVWNKWSMCCYTKGYWNWDWETERRFFFLSEELSNTSDADTFSNKHFTASIEFVIHLILFNVTSDKNKEMNKITH